MDIVGTISKGENCCSFISTTGHVQTSTFYQVINHKKGKPAVVGVIDKSSYRINVCLVYGPVMSLLFIASPNMSAVVRSDAT